MKTLFVNSVFSGRGQNSTKNNKKITQKKTAIGDSTARKKNHERTIFWKIILHKGSFVLESKKKYRKKRMKSKT